MKTIDRYLVREILPPFLIALGVLTFLMAVKPMLEHVQNLLVKGVPPPTIGFLLLTLLPQSLGITIPMALLTGVLMGLGRLSADREAVAFLACGVSPLRLLRPVMALAVVAAAANTYLLVKVVPDANQTFREVTFRLLAQQGENDIRPGLFYEGFPGKVIRVGAQRPGGGWQDVMIADTSQPGRPAITMAGTGFLEIDEARREVAIVLPGESQQYLPGREPGVYDTATVRDQRFAVSAASVFGTGDVLLSRGRAEMSLAELRRAEAQRIADGHSPHPEIIHRHQMFSFPVACLVFALIGVALGVHTRKEGKLGGLTLGLIVIFVYYAVMALFEALTKGGHFPAHWARWVPNIVVGLVALAALRARIRNTGKEWTFTLPAWTGRLWRPATPPDGVPTSQRTDRIVLVIRLPDFRFPRVRLLDRYVSRRYLGVVTLSFAGMLVLFYVGTLIDRSERLFKGEATTALLIEYLYHSTPQFVVHVIPMATLVAVLATIGGLTRTGELTVMRACGISLYRVGLPLVVLSLVLSGGLFMLDDRILAHANQRVEAIEDRITGNLSHTTNVANSNWLAGRDGRIYYYSWFDIDNRVLSGLSIFTPAADGGRLQSHAMIDRAVFNGNRWSGERGWTQVFGGAAHSARVAFEKRDLDLEAPDEFSGMHNRTADLMTFTDLRAHIVQLDAQGENAADIRVELARRLAFPFVTLVMTVLGIPFGVSTGKRGALYGVGVALLLGAGYWLIDTFFVAIGEAGLLTPWFAAWAANLLFMAGALYATLTVRT